MSVAPIDWASEAYQVGDELAITLTAGRAEYRLAARNIGATIEIQPPPVFHDLDGDGRDEAIVIAAHTNEQWAGVYYCAYVFAIAGERPIHLERMLLGASHELRVEAGAIIRPDGSRWRWNAARRRVIKTPD